jgi:hypothetical protein
MHHLQLALIWCHQCHTNVIPMSGWYMWRSYAFAHVKCMHSSLESESLLPWSQPLSIVLRWFKKYFENFLCRGPHISSLQGIQLLYDLQLQGRPLSRVLFINRDPSAAWTVRRPWAGLRTVGAYKNGCASGVCYLLILASFWSENLSWKSGTSEFYL